MEKEKKTKDTKISFLTAVLYFLFLLELVGVSMILVALAKNGLLH